MPSLFSALKGWHAPAGRRTCETPASSPGQADQTGRAGRCRETLDPGRQIVSQDNPSGVSRFGGQAGTQRPLTLRPHHHKTGEAGPEALIHILPADSAGHWHGPPQGAQIAAFGTGGDRDLTVVFSRLYLLWQLTHLPDLSRSGPAPAVTLEDKSGAALV